MRYRILLLAALGLAALMPSCVKERLTAPEDGKTTLKIATRSLNENAPDPDFRISTLRVMAFDKASGNVKSNKLYSDAELTSNPISHTMYVGAYDFVFVGNEPASLTTALNGVVRASELSGAGFNIPALAFSCDPDISVPMVLRVDNVTVLADDAGVSIDGGAVQKPWNVALERIGILIEDIVLTSKSDLAGATITSVKFSNIPNSVPLMTGGSYPTDLTFGVSPTFDNFSSGVTIGEPEKSSYGVPAGDFAMSFAPPRIILPHNEFTPIGNADRAISMELVTSKGTFNYKVGLAPETDYTLPRNCKYRLVCTTDPSGLEVHVQAVGWTELETNSDPLNRMLNVSAVETTVSTISRTRIYFWSNQPAVSVETHGRTSTDGTTWSGTYMVSGIFEGLGNGEANISYNATTGTGYIDIAANLANTATTGTYYRSIFINAGGLKREVRVKFNHMRPVSGRSYVGTFHRKNQTGERIVYMANASGDAWTATASESFVRLSTLRSQDNTTLTDKPDDAEKYQVEGNAQTVSGTGVIYFRVGMTSKTASNRYAKIEITYNGNQKKYIYVRQGEDADYLMRPGDPGTGVDGRTLAAKFSPYNLTASAFTGGGTSTTQLVNIGTRGGVPTDYPSQAGAFFRWAHTDGVIAYNAAVPNNTTPTIWDSNNTVSDYWATAGATYESCPAGYRRPTDGITTGAQGSTIAANSSEMFQSLFLNPPTDLSSNNDNTAWGYYADGFFDRRIIGTQTALSGSQTNTAVATDNSTVAYSGELFYNQYNDASLFLPASGSRSASDGCLRNTGSYGYYWSASSSGSVLGFDLSFSSSAFRDNTSRHYGFSVRCVLDEQSADRIE